jgi:hypothetical protein
MQIAYSGSSLERISSADGSLSPRASAFVARRCFVSKVETAGGVFQVREEKTRRRAWGLHRTP